jgi:uroporphyrinogen-III decarboxylase
MATTTPPAEAALRFEERERRLNDAIALRQPDRVPVAFFSTFWHTRQNGLTNYQAMYDYEKSAAAIRDAAVKLQPDGVMSPYTITAIGRVLDQCDYRLLNWPGHGVAEDRPYQYVEKEVMSASEYDLFLEDPSYFFWTRYLPRMGGNLGALAKLPQLPSFYYFLVPFAFAAYTDPEVAAAMKVVADTGAEALQVLIRDAQLTAELAGLGFPSLAAYICPAPFDYFADCLRGSKGIMLDMYRKKDKLLAAMDRIVPMLVRGCLGPASMSRSKIIFMPMHWGLDGFMSAEQFQTFFWPSLRKVMLGLIENGLTPCVLWEANCTTRLETIADIPRGKAIYWFERTDLVRAKQVLGDVVCLRGNVPVSLLNLGTPEEVSAYCRTLIEKVGRNGGFILDAAIGITDEAKPENVAAMFRSVHEYGR